jgi:hypothetical protein
MVMDFGEKTFNLIIKAANDEYSRPILDYLIDHLKRNAVIR